MTRDTGQYPVWSVAHDHLNTKITYLKCVCRSRTKRSWLCSCRSQNHRAPSGRSPVDCLPAADQQLETWKKWEKNPSQHGALVQSRYSCIKKPEASPWGGVLRVVCAIVERLAVLPPQQRGVTLLLLWLPAEEGSAVQGHTGSHIPPESAHLSAGFKQRRFGAPGLCAKTYLCY